MRPQAERHWRKQRKQFAIFGWRRAGSIRQIEKVRIVIAGLRGGGEALMSGGSLRPAASFECEAVANRADENQLFQPAVKERTDRALIFANNRDLMAPRTTNVIRNVDFS